MKHIVLSVLALGAAASQAEPIRFHIGTYSTRGSEGVYTATLDSETGALSAPVLAAKAESPNWLAWHPQGKVLYAVGDRVEADGKKSGGEVVAYNVAADGTLSARNRQPTGMGAPCHLGVDPSCSMLVGANYGEGAVVTFLLGAAGEIGPVAQTVKHEGSGPHARQKTPHAHGVTFDPTGLFVFIPDLGKDQIVGYRAVAPAARIEASAAATASTPAGAGPRHFAFHPNGRFAYSINELDATVTQFAWDGTAGTLKPLGTVKSLPADATTPNTSAEIAVHPSGKFLYASNRGHDSIAVFALDAASGEPKLIQNEASGGKAPRGFAIDPTGHYLVSANQDSDRIITLRIDQATGRLTPTGSGIEVPAPVCIAFGAK